MSKSQETTTTTTTATTPTSSSESNKWDTEIDDFRRAPVSLDGEFRAFLTTLVFLTRLPAWPEIDLHPGVLMRGMAYFSLMGSIIGLLLSIVFDSCHILLGLPPVVSATLTMTTEVVLTGCFHEDGLSDAADGIGGGWTKKQILTIMTDSRVGTYGCAALILYMVAKIQLLAALASKFQFGGESILLAQCMARVTAPYLIRTHDYIDDEDGPKSYFYSYMIRAKYIVTWWRVGLATLISVSVASSIVGLNLALVLLTSAWVTAHLSGRYADQILGGVVGDYLGATICVSEIVILSILYVLYVNNIDIDIEGLIRFIKVTIFNADVQQTTASFRAQAVSMLRWEDVMDSIDDWNHPDNVLIRAIVACVLLRAWYWWFGKQDVSSSEGKEETPSTDQDCVSRSSTSDERLKAQQICSSLESSFQKRHDAARGYIDVLAKPVGSLGTLEEWAARLCALQGTMTPTVDNVSCLIFAADHGAAKSPEEGGEGCSAYPQVVTQSILKGLERGIAGASVLAKANNVTLKVVDCGVAGDEWHGQVVSSSPQKMVGGTLNFCVEPAMTIMSMKKCLRIGRDELKQIVSSTGSRVVCLGEVGIGNTTSSSALIAHFTGVPVKQVCGGGATTGRTADDEVVKKKIAIVNKAIRLHKKSMTSCQDALARLGGAEIVALVGCILQASEEDVALMIDGFIVSAAALVAVNLSPRAARIMFFATKSAEKGQSAAIEKIKQIAEDNGVVPPSNPCLDMGLRMGEATGGLSAVPLLRSAAAMLNMGTIQEILSS